MSQLLQIPAAADSLGVSQRTLKTLIKSGEIPIVRVGRAHRIDPAAIDAFVVRQRPSHAGQWAVFAIRTKEIAAREGATATAVKRRYLEQASERLDLTIESAKDLTYLQLHELLDEMQEAQDALIPAESA